MFKIYDNLFIGNDSDCITAMKNDNFAVIHACKTCHQRILQYKNSLPKTHPNYLIYKNNNNLFLNMVDMQNELLPDFTNPIIREAMTFIDGNIIHKNVLIHCNQGQSRSPSIALVYLAKKNIISNISYDFAIKDFLLLYPLYNPGQGIYLYLKNNWKSIV